MTSTSDRPIQIDCKRCPVRTRHLEGHANDDDLARLASVLSGRSYRASQTLALEGHPAEQVFFLRAGAVRLTQVQPDGSELLVDFVTAGGIVGAEALFGSEHAVTATACGPLVCCTARADTLRAALPTQPAVVLALLREASEELARARSRATEFATWPAEQRVARFLVETLPTWRAHVREFTQADMARSLALTPETLCRVLGDFRRRGWVNGRGSALGILEEAPLARLAAVGRSGGH